MRFSVQGDYVFDRVLVSKEKALCKESSAKNFNEGKFINKICFLGSDELSEKTSKKTSNNKFFAK